MGPGTGKREMAETCMDLLFAELVAIVPSPPTLLAMGMQVGHQLAERCVPGKGEGSLIQVVQALKVEGTRSDTPNSEALKFEEMRGRVNLGFWRVSKRASLLYSVGLHISPLRSGFGI